MVAVEGSEDWNTGALPDDLIATREAGHEGISRGRLGIQWVSILSPLTFARLFLVGFSSVAHREKETVVVEPDAFLEEKR
jgi:hypothetical protein